MKVNVPRIYYFVLVCWCFYRLHHTVLLSLLLCLLCLHHNHLTVRILLLINQISISLRCQRLIIRSSSIYWVHRRYLSVICSRYTLVSHIVMILLKWAILACLCYVIIYHVLLLWVIINALKDKSSFTFIIWSALILALTSFWILVNIKCWVSKL